MLVNYATMKYKEVMPAKLKFTPWYLFFYKNLKGTLSLIECIWTLDKNAIAKISHCHQLSGNYILTFLVVLLLSGAQAP